MADTVVGGDRRFLDRIDPATVHTDLVDDGFVRRALAAHGGHHRRRRLLVAAEMLGVRSGLGYQILNALDAVARWLLGTRRRA